MNGIKVKITINGNLVVKPVEKFNSVLNALEYSLHGFGLKSPFSVKVEPIIAN